MSILPKKYLFTAIAAVLSLFIQAQVQRGGIPVSWNLEEVVDDNHSFISLPEIDIEALLLEDLANDEMVRKVYLGQNFELRKKKLEF